MTRGYSIPLRDPMHHNKQTLFKENIIKVQ